jgi:hypothetical protein
MRGHRLARPYGAGFAGGVVAGGEHEIERRRARSRELVPRDAIGRLTLGRISVFGARPSVSATPGPTCTSSRNTSRRLCAGAAKSRNRFRFFHSPTEIKAKPSCDHHFSRLLQCGMDFRVGSITADITCPLPRQLSSKAAMPGFSRAAEWCALARLQQAQRCVLI